MMIVRPAKSGFTLFELMVVLSVTSILMAVVTVWIGHALRFSSQMRNHERQHQQLMRLERSLRDNVRTCQTMAIKKEHQLILFRGGKRCASYTISATDVLLEKHAGDQIIRERFRLTPESQPYWDTSQMPQTIGLIVARGLIPPVIQPDETWPEKFEGQKPDAAREIASHPPNVNRHNIGDPAEAPIDIHILVGANRFPMEFETGSDRSDD